jgi:Xaa-Pro aminopeptidase
MYTKIRKSPALLFILIVPFVWYVSFSVVYPQDNAVLSPQVYADRRAAVLEQMPDSSVAVFQSATTKTRSNDVNYEYRQDSNLLYLTGIADPNTVLILVKGGIEIDGAKVAELLFVPKGNPRTAVFDKTSISVEAAQSNLGFKYVKTYDKFKNEINNILEDKKLVFLSFQTDFMYEPVSNQKYFISRNAKKALKEKFPQLKVKSPGKILTSLRQIKSPEELRLLQKAIDLTCQAQKEAMRSAKPGLYEYQLEAIIEYMFKRGGSEYPAFPAIVASGPNSVILHYSKNRRKMETGDLVVMDIGAEYHGYAADVTRTIPVSGKFTQEQKRIYEIVLRAQKQAIAAIKPGVPFRKIHKVASKIIEEAGYGQYFNHATSHYVGLDVHDVGDYGALQVGMVITVEPGIYIPEGSDLDKAYWNIGVRIEDDVLVTEDGYKILSDQAPKEIDDIERLMKEKSELAASLE